MMMLKEEKKKEEKKMQKLTALLQENQPSREYSALAPAHSIAQIV